MLLCTITTQRSGSKLLASSFNGGTVVRSYAEIFSPDARNALGSFVSYVDANGYRTLSEQIPEEVLDRYFEMLGRGVEMTHFDLMFNQLEVPCLSWNRYHEEFIYGYLKSRNAFIISLERNLRDTFLSKKVAFLTGRSHRTSRDPPITYSGPLQHLDREEFAHYQAGMNKRISELLASMSRYPYFHRINYSEIILGVPDTLRVAIANWGRACGRTINPEHLQTRPSVLAPTGVDYRTVFENLHELT
jgi:hypothetical protein